MKVYLPDIFQPTDLLSELHKSIVSKLNKEPVNREVMKKLVEKEIRSYQNEEDEEK